MRFDTKLVHSGADPEAGTGDVVPAVHVAVSYDRRRQPQPPTHFYARGENPTREALEECLAALEDAAHAATFASGQAAGAAVLSLLAPGQRIVCVDDLYSGTRALLAHAARYGVRVDFADLADPDAARAALAADDLAMVWVESPTNPLLKVVDVAELCRHTRDRDVLVVVDNTFASPALQQPLRLGADISLYSTTKFVAGHSDVMGGALVYDDPGLDRRLREHRATTGAVPGALDCFLVHRGLRTLSLRMSRQVQNARALVDLLRASPRVGAVRYPGLPDHPQYPVAKRQMSEPGAIVSFEYRGDPARVLDRVRLFACAVSLGGVRSLLECPALMTHRPLPAAERAALGITDSLIRLSAGIEDPRDLVADLAAALA